MQPTREKILHYLGKFPGASAEEISRYLEMTAANIRYHLGFLVDSGKVQVSGERPTGGAGRPIQLYNLTPAAIGFNLIPLIEAVLDNISDDKTGKSIRRKIAQQLAADFDGRNQAKNPINRYNQALEYLNKYNYLASWEAHPEGPQIELRHCPYGNLAQTHPALCQIDRSLITLLFDVPVELFKKRSFNRNPYSPCIFRQGRASREI